MRTNARRLVGSDRVLTIAHRGNSSRAPENTLPAFLSAIAARADVVELDYRQSRDGVPVVVHDETLDRTTDAVQKWGTANNAVAGRTIGELGELDAGGWFDPTFAGTDLPTLAEALSLIQKNSVTMIERKGGDARTCVKLLERGGWLGDVVVQAFEWSFLAECHQLVPELTLGALGEGSLTEETLDRVEAIGAVVVGWDQATLTAESVSAARRRGLAVWAWTVDDPLRAAQLVEFGVNGLISNVPARIRQTSSTVRVVGIGSPHGDDQAGWRVVERLREHSKLPIEARAVRHSLELLDHLDDCGTLIVVDACQTGRPAGTILRTVWPDARLGATLAGSTHGMDVDSALRLAVNLGRPLPRILLLGIEAGTCDPGTDLSPAVQAALPELERQLIAEIESVADKAG